MQHKATIFIHWFANDYAWDNGGHFSYNPADLSHRIQNGISIGFKEYTLLGKTDIDIEIADFDPREKLIDSLKAKKQEILVVATQEAGQIEEKIQQLLALPNSSNIADKV